MKTYRVAILGCRGRGTAASHAYHAHPRTEVVALCDLVQERLDTLGDELGVAARFTDLDEMIVQTQPDLVAIPTGTELWLSRREQSFTTHSVCACWSTASILRLKSRCALTLKVPLR